MATDTGNQRPASAGKRSRNKRTVKIQDFVSEKLNVTRRQVRQVDVMSNLIALLAMVLVFLLTVAIIDAWIFPLGTIGRWAGFLTLVLGTLTFLLMSVGRSMMRKVNPDYAAQMIEESQPEFKNSLLNYVSLSRKPQGTKAAVLDAVSRQAATDISTVPVETMVDRSAMIRVSMILAGIIFFGAMYTLFSPKNPFQSIARVILPGAKLAAPSVVTIEDVQPGDAEEFFGNEVEVSAKVVGRHSPEDVRLIFSTTDGQIVDRVIPMTVQSGSTDEYFASLSTDGSGIQQSLKYRIVARDGMTPDYVVTVRTNPSIAIETVSVQPPKYSKLEKWTQQEGSIEALEGTRVTINAKANLPIETAEIELLNANEDGDFVTARKIRMNVQAEQSKQTVGSFIVAMNGRRTKPAATHYRLNFVSVEGHRNQQPNNFPIKVIPDLAPEIKVLNPLEKETSVPLDGQTTIRIQANDADFEISKIELELEQDNQRIFGQPMQLDPVQGMSRVNGEFLLDVSRQFPFLKVGDQIVFHASAHDNRVLPSGKAAANVTSTENYVIEITEPKASQQNSEQMDQQRDQQNNEQEKAEPEDRNPFDPGPEQEPPAENDRNEEQNQDPEQNNEDPERNQEMGQQEQQQNEQENGGDQSDQQPGSEENQQGAEQQQGQQQENGEQGDETKPGQQGNDGESGQQEGGMEPGEQQNANDQQQQQQQQQGGDQQGAEDGNPQAGENNMRNGERAPENDAERMAKLNEMMAEAEQQNQQGDQENREGDQQQGQQGEQQQGKEGGQQQGQQGEQQQGKEGDQQQGQQGEQQQGKEGGQQQDQQGERQQGKEGGQQQGQQGKQQQGEEGDQQQGQQGEQQQGKEGGQQQGQKGEHQQGKEGDQQQGQQGEQQQGKEGGQQQGQQGEQQQGKEGGQQQGQQGEQQQGKEGGQQQGQQGEQQQGKEGGQQQGQQGEQQQGKEGGQQPGQQGEQQQGKEGGQQQGKPGEGQPGEGKPGQGQAKPNTGGNGSGSSTGDTDLTEEEANLEYSKKATDMILNRLKNQRNNPDQKMLDAMNWSKDDMNRFIDRWEQMQKEANSGNDADRKRAEKQYKGLGLRPPGVKTKSSLDGDGEEDYLEEGAVDLIIPELRNEFRAFQREQNRSNK